MTHFTNLALMTRDPLSPFIRTLVAEVLRDEGTTVVASALKQALPDILRRAQLPPYLTKKQLCELTGWSARKVAYLKSERRIPFVQRGRTVLFPTAEIEAYLNEGFVPARTAPVAKTGEV